MLKKWSNILNKKHTDFVIKCEVAFLENLYLIGFIEAVRSQIFFKIGFLKNFTIFTGKH